MYHYPAYLHIDGYLYAILLEDITRKNAKIIDKMLKDDFSVYISMTSADINSTDDRKHFWKRDANHKKIFIQDTSILDFDVVV